MPRAGTNQVTSFGMAVEPGCEAGHRERALGVHVLPDLRLVFSLSQFKPRKPAPGELRKGPVSCSLPSGPSVE
jgi:hypothetical protein